jgi:alkylhydroperoxidase/carboxymuconolactone decarboxylase family protein YurZ
MTYSPSSRPSEIYDMPMSSILHRGQTFFNTVYGKISKRVMSQMDRSGTEDLGLVARLFYGYVLSNTSVLTPAETSLILVAGLVPQDVNPQLKGHLRGAVNNGCSVEEVRAVRDVVLWICESGGMKMLKDGEQGLGWTEEVAKI